MVTLPYLLAIQVRDQINDKKPGSNYTSTQNSFSEADFKYVTKLKYTGDDIDPRTFTNLKSITFDSNPQVDAGVISEILRKFPNIEELRIRNQSNIQILDLSMLSRLESLDITSNKILIKMVGLKDGLKNLKFYDNPSYRDANKLCEYIVKNLEHALSPNIDVLYYPEMYKAINSFNGDKQEIFDLLASHGKWTEKLTEERKTDFDASEHDIPNEHTISYRTSDVNLIHQKIASLISTLLKPEYDEQEKLMIIYLWMYKNIKYEEPKGKYEPLGTLSSVLSGKSNYKGYTKTLEYILKLAGIKTVEVPCTFLSQNIDEPKNRLNYVILKSFVDGMVYYFDPRRDAQEFQSGKNKYLPRFMISIEDFLRYYSTSNENGVFCGESISFKDKIKLIEFAEKRLSELSNDNSEHLIL